MQIVFTPANSGALAAKFTAERSVFCKEYPLAYDPLSSVFPRMLCAADCNQVLRSVVGLVSIDMVNCFAARQEAAMCLLPNKSMLCDITILITTRVIWLKNPAITLFEGNSASPLRTRLSSRLRAVSSQARQRMAGKSSFRPVRFFTDIRLATTTTLAESRRNLPWSRGIAMMSNRVSMFMKELRPSVPVMWLPWDWNTATTLTNPLKFVHATSLTQKGG